MIVAADSDYAEPQADDVAAAVVVIVVVVAAIVAASVGYVNYSSDAVTVVVVECVDGLMTVYDVVATVDYSSVAAAVANVADLSDDVVGYPIAVAAKSLLANYYCPHRQLPLHYWDLLTSSYSCLAKDAAQLLLPQLLLVQHHQLDLSLNWQQPVVVNAQLLLR